MEALQKKPSKEELRRAERRRRAAEEAQQRMADERRWRAEHPALSEADVEQLEALKRDKFPALARSGRR